MTEWLIWLLAMAVMQNAVLTTGFGSSMLLRITRRPRDILLFSGLLTGFSLLTVLIVYPLDLLLGNTATAKMVRPLVMVVIAALLYLLAVLLLKKLLPGVYTRIQRMLSLAAFNNLTIGLALVANHKVTLTLPGTVGLVLGACLGFLLLSVLTAEARERMDNPGVPAAFRGLPGALLFLGIVALALLGFGPGTLV